MGRPSASKTLPKPLQLPSSSGIFHEIFKSKSFKTLMRFLAPCEVLPRLSVLSGLSKKKTIDRFRLISITQNSNVLDVDTLLDHMPAYKQSPEYLFQQKVCVFTTKYPIQVSTLWIAYLSIADSAIYILYCNVHFKRSHLKSVLFFLNETNSFEVSPKPNIKTQFLNKIGNINFYTTWKDVVVRIQAQLERNFFTFWFRLSGSKTIDKKMFHYPSQQHNIKTQFLNKTGNRTSYMAWNDVDGL